MKSVELAAQLSAMGMLSRLLFPLKMKTVHEAQLKREGPSVARRAIEAQLSVESLFAGITQAVIVNPSVLSLPSAFRHRSMFRKVERQGSIPGGSKGEECMGA